MPSREYWLRRFEQVELAALNRGEAYVATLEREFRIAQRCIENEVDAWLRRFASNNDMSLSEARRLLSAGELAEFKWNVQDYIRFGRENALNGQWIRQLENASARIHISRLEALQIDMRQQVEALTGKRLAGMDRLAREIYTDGFLRTAFEIQRGHNIGWKLSAIDQRQLDRAISKPWALDGKTFSDRIWEQQAKLIGRLQTELTQAIMRGDSPGQAIKAIAGEFGTTKGQAGRLVMTESAYFASAGQGRCYNDLRVKRFEIVATLDMDTSDICAALDGKVEHMKNYQPGVTSPPFHPWCRTTTIPFFDDNYGERAARNADGKTYYVPSNMTFREWKKECVVNRS